MNFRTALTPIPSKDKIAHDCPPVLVGSCFSDNMALRLRRDGFECVANPGGALYNPASVADFFLRALKGKEYTPTDLVEGPRGWHLLALATKFSGADAGKVLADANAALASFGSACRPGVTAFITLGTAYVFEWKATGEIVGNCHKLPASMFTRRLMSVDECVAHLSPLVEELDRRGIKIVFTVSPIRHLGDGLHGNNVSKATLHLAVEALCGKCGSVSYFPAYEAIIDDLRDYRFTAPDMKHPTEQAADYVYELFASTYFTRDTLERAVAAHRESLAAAHRPIIAD